MTAFNSALPRNSSRTSTQAMVVPITALTSTTATDRPSVTLSAATPCGFVTALQKASQPPSVERHVSAASGSKTMKLR